MLCIQCGSESDAIAMQRHETFAGIMDKARRPAYLHMLHSLPAREARRGLSCGLWQAANMLQEGPTGMPVASKRDPAREGAQVRRWDDSPSRRECRPHRLQGGVPVAFPP